MINKKYIEAAFKIVNEVERRKNVSLPSMAKMQMAIDIASDMSDHHIEDAVVKGKGKLLTVNVGTIYIFA